MRTTLHFKADKGLKKDQLVARLGLLNDLIILPMKGIKFMTLS